ncbi:MAG TPA: BadF/BadG/BcrA/BcrD ATPase family protein [Candidatus Acidoferrales bacterium]|nr:BadF/BadG/BcrA/BcrD ATPase family protein [Candidatus Acidoferrales bacterium]
MPVFVGVDAGGSSILCAIDRDGAAGSAHGDAANVRTAGVDCAAQRIAATVRGALHGGVFDALVVGAAGAGQPEVARALENALRAHFEAGAIAVYDDAEIALRAAVPHGDGIVLIAGTGSIACAKVDAVAYRAGGYGYMLGDEGSGFSLARAALAQMLRWYDGRAAHSELFDAIAARLQVDGAQALLDRIYGEPDRVAQVAAIAPLVLDRAGAGERVATKLVQGAAVELVDLVKAVVARAGIKTRELPLVLAGGLFAENSLLTYLVETRLLADLPLLQPVKSAPPPVQGALELARRIVR